MHSHARGFSLVQMAILMTVVALAVSVMLPAGPGSSDAAKKELTIKRLKVIEEAFTGWRAGNARIPCPADGSLKFSNSNFGVQAATNGTCTGGTPAANFSSGNVVGGMLPVRTLGLPDEYALDGWGNRFTYLVDKRATSSASSTVKSITSIHTPYESSWPTIGVVAHGLSVGNTVTIAGVTGTLNGVAASNINGVRTVYGGGGIGTDWFKITAGSGIGDGTAAVTTPDARVASATITIGGGTACSALHEAASATPALSITGNGPGGGKNAVLALISHGKNGHGAFVGNGSSVANRINVSSTDTGELDNANVNSAFSTSFDGSVVSKAPTTTFDDIVVSTNRCK